MDSEVESALPPSRYEGWFDLCFRLILILIAGVWLLLPPAASESATPRNSTVATTR